TKPAHRIRWGFNFHRIRWWSTENSTLRRLIDSDKRAETAVILVVVLFKHNIAVAELRLEVEAVGSAAGIERTDKRIPVRAVGIDGPDAPENVAASALRFECAVHDAAILEQHGMQRPSQIEMSNLFQVPRKTRLINVRIGVVYHEELQTNGGVALGGA